MQCTCVYKCIIVTIIYDYLLMMMIIIIIIIIIINVKLAPKEAECLQTSCRQNCM